MMLLPYTIPKAHELSLDIHRSSEIVFKHLE